jgi:ABC-2 type transport system permease protein
MYMAFLTSAFQTRLAYRGQVWAQALGYFIEISAKVAIWSAVLAGPGAAAGVSLKDMVTYAIIGASVIVCWPWEHFIRAIGAQIKSGDVVVFLLKPLHYPLMLFSSECGNMGFRLVTLIMPVTLIGALLYGFVPPASVPHAVLFVAMWALGFVMLFLLAAIAGLLSFWLLTVFSLEWTLSALLAILSGRIVPLWYFPDAAAAVLKYLPFAWIAFHPMAVYLGQVDIAGGLWLLAMGLGWAGVLTGIVLLLWSRAARRLDVQVG